MVLFCALLKWQPWHSRLHLAYFVLLMPFASHMLGKLPAWGLSTIALGLVAHGVYCVTHNWSRPVFNPRFLAQSREQQYLAAHDGDMRRPLAELADRIVASGCRHVGVKAGFCGIEYPLWAMLRNRGFQGTYSRCFVENASARLASRLPEPSVIVTIYQVVPPEVIHEYPYRERYGKLQARWRVQPPWRGGASTGAAETPETIQEARGASLPRTSQFESPPSTGERPR
jgi:hypothetical protein